MRTLGVLVLCLGLGAAAVEAQVGAALVHDPLNYVSNTMTSLQTTVTAVQSVLMVANQVINLTGMASAAEEIAQFMADLALIQDLLRDAQGLAFDLQLLNMQITRLFSLESAPRSSSDLAHRLQEIRQVMFQANSYALQTQTLINTLVHTAVHALQLYNRIQELLGNKQGHQLTNKWLARLTVLQMKMQLETTALRRAQMIKQSSEPVLEQAVVNINQEILMDWPVGAR